MASLTLAPAPPLGGADVTIGNNRIRERGDLAMVSVAIPLGGDAALAKTLEAAWRLEMPSATRATRAGDIWAVRMTPDQIMLIFPHGSADEDAVVAAKVGTRGYVTLQTDAWVRLEVSGPDTLDALERLCPLDLDPGTFPEAASARTTMEHMGALILRLGPERFWLLSASSSGRSFLHGVEVSYGNVVG